AHHALLFVCFSSTPLAYSSSLSLHDALPICHAPAAFRGAGRSFFVWPSTVNCQLSTLDQNKVGLSDVTRHTLHFTQASPPCPPRSEEHTSELQSRENLVCRLLLEQKKYSLYY